MTTATRPSWHAMDVDAVVTRFDTGPSGLSADEAARRLELYGPNRIAEAERVWPWRILVHQLTGALMYVLMAAMVVSLAIGHWQDAIVISVVLVLNAVVGFFQEYRAEHAIAALRDLVAPRARVQRDGSDVEIRSEDLVPGDVVLLQSGDVVPADLRLWQQQGLAIDEAILTGESVPVAKSTEPLHDDGLLPLGERVCMAFMGTSVTAGRGRGLVVATSAHTEMGAIAGQIHATERVQTPLQVRMGRFGRRISVGILSASAIAFGLGLWRGEGAGEMFLTAVAIAVSAVPEGLPVVMTIALAVSARRMARRRAIVRRLPAIETLGSCTVIVTDKTGTLTRNQMTVQDVRAGGVRYAVSGNGLEREGTILFEGNQVQVAPDSPLYWTLVAGVLCNESELGQGPGTSRGDPTELALLALGAKAGLEQAELRARHPLLDELPFESARQFAATVHGNGERLLCVKGAPERVAAMCEKQLSEGGMLDIDRRRIEVEAEEMAAAGLRVLGIAIGRDAAADLQDGVPRQLLFAGLVGMLDPPRPEAARAVAECLSAGIRVIMVTGDHASTARTLAGRVGIPLGEGLPLAGAYLESLSDGELAHRLRTETVFARVSPSDKLRIVRLLSAAGEIVAVTGDGVNDAPALKSAHVGAAMGASGSDVAREASEIVLADDNFATVSAAVQEGRTAFSNLRKATFFLVSSGVGELLAILGSLVLRLPLPLLPAQILWLNVVTNGGGQVALALEPAEPDAFRKPPRDPREGILTRRLVERLVLCGLVMALGTLGVFMWEWDNNPDQLGYARVAALTTLVLFQVVHVGNCRSESRSAFTSNPLSNRFLFFGVAGSALLHVTAMYVPATQVLLRLEPLELDTWLRIAAVAVTIVAAVELHKLVRPTPEANVT